MEVWPGEDATLLFSNFSSSPTQIIWFRLVNRTQAHCILSIYISTDPISFCNGVKHEKFEVTSNISTVFLKIKYTDLSDFGLWSHKSWQSETDIKPNMTSEWHHSDHSHVLHADGFQFSVQHSVILFLCCFLVNLGLRQLVKSPFSVVTPNFLTVFWLLSFLHSAVCSGWSVRG